MHFDELEVLNSDPLFFVSRLHDIDIFWVQQLFAKMKEEGDRRRRSTSEGQKAESKEKIDLSGKNQESESY